MLHRRAHYPPPRESLLECCSSTSLLCIPRQWCVTRIDSYRMMIDLGSQSFVHALYHLASKIDYVEPLRKEIIEWLGTSPEDWTKSALGKCWKLDSFLKECQRLNGLGVCKWIPPKCPTFRPTIPCNSVVTAQGHA